MTDAKLFPVVILAGGLATRLRPLTETIPKSLIAINGEPFIAHQLRLLKSHGFKEVVICIGFLGERIKEYVGNGDRFGLSVRYSEEQEELLGTAGAIKKALPLLHEHFFVVYGDSYLPCPYKQVQETFELSKKSALMTVYRNQGLWDTSNVQYDGSKIVAYDKITQTQQMEYIDYGLGLFNKSAFSLVPENIPYDLSKIYQTLLANDQLAVFEAKNRFYEIGSFAGIQDLGYYLALSNTKEALN